MCQVYWDMTHNVFFYWCSDLISHTNTRTAHSRVSKLTHPYNIYLHHLLRAHSSYLYEIKWLLSTMPSLFKNYSIVKDIYHLIRCDKTRFLMWDTDNTDRNGVNNKTKHTHIHTHTHTPNSERKITQKGFVSMKISDTPCFFQNTPHLFYETSIFMGKIWNPPVFDNLENSFPSLL